MNYLLNILIVEDSEDDTLLLLRELRRSGYRPTYTRVDTRETMLAALDRQMWDVVVADYSMPHFGAMDALAVLQERGLKIPFIIVSGSIAEDVAAAAMKAGAHDYLMKGNLTRLVPAIEREMQDEMLRQAQKLESLGVLAGGVAHDFNNLLVAMLGQSSLALSKLPENSPARNHIEKVIKAAERAADLTRQMLAYSGRGRFETRPLSLNEIVTDNLHLLEAGVSKQVTINADLNSALPLIDADPGQLQQVVMNLILNAAEAFGLKAGTVYVSTNVRTVDPLLKYQWSDGAAPSEEEPFVALDVQDDGAGMDAETLAKIFDPFFTTKATGRGLGLAAVLGIVRGHGGGISVSSEIGRGTTFSLLFPISRSAPSHQLDQTAAAPKTNDSNHFVLIIDDEEPVREAVTDILKQQGVNVISAHSGIDGVNAFQQNLEHIDLIILDHSMPGMDGEETFRALRQVHPGVRVLLSSGYNRADVTTRFEENGLVGFLQKPFSASRLMAEVSRFVRPAIV